MKKLALTLLIPALLLGCIWTGVAAETEQPEDEIPEMVQMEFYGCYPGAYICDFITLTDESGWGFFEMPEIDMP